ncbi:MAG: complex I subunit 5 family protein [Candidatus Odinarchaeia archaeon]
MQTVLDLVWLLPIIFPMVGAVLTPLISAAFERMGAPKARDFFAALMLLLTAWSVINIYPQVSSGPISLFYIGAATGGTGFVIDMLSWFMSIIFACLGFLVAIYSIVYMERDTGLTKYYVLLQMLVGGMIGVVYAADFFTLFVFWEIMALSGYTLVAFRKNRWEPIEAGFKYLMMSAFGSTLILFSMSMIYGLTGSVNLAYISQALSTATPTPLLYILLGMIIVGFGITASIVPFHAWLPDAHPAAPSGISAMLSGVVIKTGVYGILRLGTLFFAPDIWNAGFVIAAFAILTMSVGNVMALLQTDIKRLLAFSSIANIGYILAGLSIGMIAIPSTVSPTIAAQAQTLAVAGGLFHIMNHAVMKGLLFLVAGAFLYRLHTRDLNILRGIGKKMPITAFCLVIGALGLAGVPPLSGFWSKFMIIWGQVSADQILIAALTLLNSTFSVGYYLRLIQIIVFSEPSEQASKVKEAPAPILIPIVLLTIAIVVIGIFNAPFISLAEQAAEAILNSSTYVGAIP